MFEWLFEAWSGNEWVLLSCSFKTKSEKKTLVPGTVRFSICHCHSMRSLPLENPQLAPTFTDFYQYIGKY